MRLFSMLFLKFILTLRSFESSAIKNHIRSHTDERPFNCSECEMKFKIKQHLNKHKLKHLSDINLQKPYKCEWFGCERRFTCISYMRAHIRKRHTDSQSILIK